MSLTVPISLIKCLARQMGGHSKLGHIYGLVTPVIQCTPKWFDKTFIVLKSIWMWGCGCPRFVYTCYIV